MGGETKMEKLFKRQRVGYRMIDIDSIRLRYKTLDCSFSRWTVYLDLQNFKSYFMHELLTDNKRTLRVPPLKYNVLLIITRIESSLLQKNRRDERVLACLGMRRVQGVNHKSFKLNDQCTVN